MKKINFGCGEDIRNGWVNIDKFKGKGVDLVFDAEKESLLNHFEENSIEEVFTAHTLEHLFNADDVFLDFLKIIKPDGILEIKVPHYMRAKNHLILHKRTFSLNSFTGFYKKKQSSKSLQIKTQQRLKEMSVELHWMNSPSNSILHTINVVMEAIINMNRASKDFFDSYLGYYIGGFYEIHYKFKVVK